MFRLVYLFGLVFLLAGCLQSKPSDLAVEVMAKRYWQDQLQLNDWFTIQEVRFLTGQLEGGDLYSAQVQYRVQATLSERDLIERLKQADQQGSSTTLVSSDALNTLADFPNGFQQNQNVDFVKSLQFRNTERGWLLEREWTR